MLERSNLATLLVLAACSAPVENATRADFRLCLAESQNPATIEIDFDDLFGILDDYGTNLRRCHRGPVACLEFPIVISAPDRFPGSPTDEVKWAVRNYRFTLRRSSSTANDYLMEVEEVSSNAGTLERYWYGYNEQSGVTSFRTAGLPRQWVRCAGRLTFADVRELDDRLARVDYLPVGGEGRFSEGRTNVKPQPAPEPSRRQRP